MAKKDETKDPNDPIAPPKADMLRNDPSVDVPVAKTGSEMVQIPAAQLSEILEKIQVLEGLAGKNAMTAFRERMRDNTVKSAHLKQLNGQPIVGWRKGKQEILFNERGQAYGEILTIIVRTLDGVETDMRYIDFEHIKDIKYYAIRGVRHDVVLGETLILEDENGKAIEVGNQFINP